MSGDSTLTVVVPAYSAATVGHALASIEGASASIGGEVEIVVVLNGPMPELEGSERLRLLDPGSNVGFAAAVMLALRQSSGDWIATINDDCVVEPDALEVLLEVGRTDDRIGAVTGLLVFDDRPDVVNAAGIEVDELGIATERLLGRRVGFAATELDVFGGSGAFTLYRRSMLDDVGGLDESFFAYYEDADLAWRAQAAGWRCVYTPRALARHAHSQTLGHGSAAKHFLVGRNRVRMLAKNATPDQLRRRWPRIVLYDLGYVLFAAVRYRTLAPLHGRIAGAREWRSYRAAGAPRRGHASLAPARGVVAALGRDRAYRR